MKKLLICLCLVLLLTSCNLNNKTSSSSWEKGFDEGFSQGFDEGFDEGYYEGYNEGFDEILNVIYEAESYAADNGGWHPYEAMWVIEMYQTKKSYYPDGSLPTKEEYYNAINSLIYFYEFFEYELYEKFYDP